ncbi:SA1362 family protein [Virgibacillus kimchii]
MSSNKLATLVYIIIGLAAIGLVSQLLTNTVGFLTNILVMLAFGLAIFGIIYFVFLRKKSPSNDAKKYKQAVKQSKAKYKSQEPSRAMMAKNKKANTSLQSRKKLHKRASHLRVIDGNKSNPKNRASL